MKKEIFLPLTALFSIFLIVFFSCKRELSFERKDPVKESKYWFNKTYDRLLTLKNGKLVGGNNYPDWRFAKVYKPKGRMYDIVEMPLLQNIRHRLVLQTDNAEKNNYKISSVKKLLIFTNGSDHHFDAIMTIVPDKEFLKTNFDISTINTENVPSNFNGYILFERFDGRALKNFKYKNGIIKSVVKLTPVANNNNSTSVHVAQIRPPYIQDKCTSCESFYNAGDVISNENDGANCQGLESICAMLQDLPQNEDLMCEQDIYTLECNCGGMTVSSEGCSWIMEYYGDGGNGGGNTYNPNVGENISVDTSISNNFPCLDTLLQQMPNCNIEAQKILHNTFNVNTKINLHFQIDWSVSQNSLTDAETTPGTGTWNTPGGGVDTIWNYTDTIKLNPYTITNAAKEYLVSVIYHEAFHAYLNWQFYRMGAGEVDSTYIINRFPIFWTTYFTSTYTSQHEQMASSYVNALAELVKLYYNPLAPDSIRNIVSNSLAWGGLEETTSWLQPGRDTCRINSDNQTARNYFNTQQYSSTTCGTIIKSAINDLKLLSPCH